MSVDIPISDKFISPKNGDYLTPLVFGLDNKDSILKNVPESIYYQAMATNFSYVGDYKKSLEYWDFLSDSTSFLTRSDAQLADQLSFQNAKLYILKKALSEHILMFNEAHHIPMHRAFIMSLLTDLRKEGFKYLALEALSHPDEKDLNKRGYVLQKTGTYTCEPIYAELINLALALNFKIVAYERPSPCSESQKECRIKREKAQAAYLSELIQTDSTAKIIVLAGYDHIIEKGTFKMMAQYFKENTGIDPLTIDQVDMCEKSKTVFEEPFYKYILSKYAFMEPMLAFNKDSSIVLTSKKGQVDLQIIFPRTDFKEFKPKWVNILGTKKKFDLTYLKQKLNKKQWVLIQSFILKDFNQDQIPCDQIVCNLNVEDVAKHYLYLNKGDYILKVTTLNNEKLYEESIKID
jgi:hypothetical protein